MSDSQNSAKMKIISLGLGVQSTAVYLMSSLGYLKRADHAIFADPGAELPDTYETLALLKDWAKYNNGIPIHVVSKSLYADLLKQKNSTGQRFAAIPAFTAGGGMIRRQCTKEYKIEPVIKKTRALHGLSPRQRLPMTEMWLGISMDEIQRAKTSRLPRIQYYYPLIEEKLTRGDCVRFFEDRSFPVPKKSACVFCPYHSDKGWKDLKDNYPKEWNKVIKIDETMRQALEDRGLVNKLYLHRSCTPLKDVEFADQQELFMCEEGFCGL